MTNYHGGLNTSSIYPRSQNKQLTNRKINVKLEKLFVSKINHDRQRKVREIVTVSGQRPRGHFPSRKAKHLKYESLIELDALRVFEVASHVSELITQQLILSIANGDKINRYTPDLTAKILGERCYVEVKPKNFAKNPDVANRMRAVVNHMQENNLKFFFVTCEDLRADGLQDKLRTLLSKRPRPGRYNPKRDPNTWDSPSSELTDPELTGQWLNAQKICNDLLERAMKRDPDSLFPSTQI